MKYCSKCLMPNTRPGMIFENGICSACINFEKQKKTDWDKRWKLFEKKCEKYRGINGDGYDCAIAVSGGKDSHFQVHILKEKMKMNPVLFTVGNIDWTEIGRRNLENLSERFGCDIFQLNPNRKVTRILSKKLDYLSQKYTVLFLGHGFLCLITGFISKDYVWVRKILSF